MTATTTAEPPVVLTSLEARTRQFLAARAMQASPADPMAATITYTALRDAMDAAGTWTGSRATGIAASLDRINRYEHERGRPMLTALVVLAGNPRGGSGPGFFGCAERLGETVPDGGQVTFWQMQLTQVIRYWHSL